MSVMQEALHARTENQSYIVGVAEFTGRGFERHCDRGRPLPSRNPFFSMTERNGWDRQMDGGYQSGFEIADNMSKFICPEFPFHTRFWGSCS